MTAAAAASNVSTLPTKAPIPPFEGQVVEYTTVKISGLSAAAGMDNVVISTDDRVRLVGEFKVVSVLFKVDKEGKLYREQTLTPQRVDPCPWDPTDPTDDGILRARATP